jgi:hypothetical protein
MTTRRGFLKALGILAGSQIAADTTATIDPAPPVAPDPVRPIEFQVIGIHTPQGQRLIGDAVNRYKARQRQ